MATKKLSETRGTIKNYSTKLTTPFNSKEFLKSFKFESLSPSEPLLTDRSFNTES